MLLAEKQGLLEINVFVFLLIEIEISDKSVNMDLVPLLGQCLANFGVHSGPKIGPKTNPQKCVFLVDFWIHFLGLKALQVPLESRLEPLMLVLRATKTRKVWFPFGKITLFAIAAFWHFEALEDAIGPMLALLGPV